MGTLRKIKGQDRWKRHEPKLSEETLKDLHRFALQDMENDIYDYVAKWGESFVGLLHHRVTINDQFWLTLPLEKIGVEAVRNLARGGVVEILKKDGARMLVKPTKSSSLPDIQLKILQALDGPVALRPADFKHQIGYYCRVTFDVKEIRAALAEMKRKGLVDEVKDWQGKKAWTKV